MKQVDEMLGESDAIIWFFESLLRRVKQHQHLAEISGERNTEIYTHYGDAIAQSFRETE